MGFFEVVALAIVQGLTEFLPVSSSGHLVIARVFFGISDVEGTAFDAFLHLGTLMAVLVYYWSVWWGIIRGIFCDDAESKDKRQLVAKLAIATVPAAVVGYAAQHAMGSFFRTPYAVAIGLLVTATVLLAGDYFAKRVITIRRARFKDAAFIGVAQVAALIPGISRSGMTIAAGRWRGLGRQQAANFSFLLSAPIIAGAGLSSLQILMSGGGFAGEQLLLGFVVSFLSGIVAIAVFLRLVERLSFVPFVVYLIVIAGALFVL